MITDNAVQELVESLKPTPQDANSTYSAVVSRVDEENVVWVNLVGSDKETPTASTSSEVKAGDVVTVEWRSNRLYIAGNYSNPSAGIIRVGAVETAANTAREAANNAVTDAGRAREAADSAVETARSVEGIAKDAQTNAGIAKSAADSAMKGLGQVEDVVGTLNWITAHSTITTDTTPQAGTTYYIKHLDGTYEIVTDTTGKNPAQEGWYVLDEALQNYVLSHLSLTNDGLYVMADGSEWKVRIADDGVYILDPNNQPANQMTASGNIVGYEGETHVEIDYHSLQLVDKEGETYFYVSDLRSNHTVADEYGEGFYAVITDTAIGDGDKVYFVLSNTSLTANYKVYVNGIEASNVTKATSAFRFAVAPVDGSIVTATYPTADQNVKAYTAGVRRNSENIGAMSFAEGGDTTASGRYAHAEGALTTAGDDYSHAEGYRTTASGLYSHAQNEGTVAGYDNQTAIGKYNDNKSDTLLEIGNGVSDSKRSNSHEFTEDGNARLALDITATSGTDKDIYDALVALGWDSDVIV